MSGVRIRVAATAVLPYSPDERVLADRLEHLARHGCMLVAADYPGVQEGTAEVVMLEDLEIEQPG